MKATIDGITYEGTEEEIRRIVENQPNRPPVTINWQTPPAVPPTDGIQRNWDGSPRLTC